MNDLLRPVQCVAGDHIHFVYDPAAPGGVVVVIVGGGVRMAAPLSEIIRLARVAKGTQPELMRMIDVKPLGH